MTDMVKKYVPYAVIILLVYMLLPLVFIPDYSNRLFGTLLLKTRT